MYTESLASTCYNYVIVIVNHFNKLLECRTCVQSADAQFNLHVFMNGFPTTFMNPGIVSSESSALATIHWHASRVFCPILIGMNGKAIINYEWYWGHFTQVDLNDVNCKLLLLTITGDILLVRCHRGGLSPAENRNQLISSPPLHASARRGAIANSNIMRSKSTCPKSIFKRTYPKTDCVDPVFLCCIVSAL